MKIVEAIFSANSMKTVGAILSVIAILLLLKVITVRNNSVNDVGESSVIISGNSVSVEGIALSVATGVYGETYARSDIAVVISNDGDRNVYRSIRSNSRNAVMAAAIIQSEISDGDEETVRLIGGYGENGTFVFTRIEANGMSLSLK